MVQLSATQVLSIQLVMGLLRVSVLLTTADERERWLRIASQLHSWWTSLSYWLAHGIM